MVSVYVARHESKGGRYHYDETKIFFSTLPQASSKCPTTKKRRGGRE